MSEPGEMFDIFFSKEILQPNHDVPTMYDERTIEGIWKISVDESVFQKEMVKIIITDELHFRKISVKAVIDMLNPMQYRATVDGEEIIISSGEEDVIQIQVPHFIGQFKWTKTTVNNAPIQIQHDNIIREEL